MGITNAARIFASIYGVQEAQKRGFSITEEDLQLASATPVEGINKLGADLSAFLSKLNKGMMG